jgi:catechol 2,3-dioxygenase
LASALAAYAPLGLESHRSPIHIEAVTLVVRDIDRMTSFYRDVIGLAVLHDAGNSVTLGNDGVSLITLRSDPQAQAPREGAPGLFHTAFLLPERRDLAQWVRTAVDNTWAIEGMADHLVSEAFYLSDPEGNGIEIYRDRSRAEWIYDDGKVRMANERIDIPELLSLADVKAAKTYRMPTGARIGHVHLCVNALDRAADVIETQLGMAVMCNYPGATFFGSGGYHHHIATNVWRTAGGQVREVGQLGLAAVTLAADRTHHAALSKAWSASGGVVGPQGPRITTLDGLSFDLVTK